MLVVLAMEGRPPMVETVGLTIVLEVAVEVPLAVAPLGVDAGAGAMGAATACGACGILGGGPPAVVEAALPSAAKLGGTTGP